MEVILTTFCQQIIPCIVMPISGNCKVTLLNVCGKTSSALMVTLETCCEMEKAARATCVSVPWLLSGTIHFCINCTVLHLTPRIVWACPEATWDLWHDAKLYCKKLPLVLHFQLLDNRRYVQVCLTHYGLSGLWLKADFFILGFFVMTLQLQGMVTHLQYCLYCHIKHRKIRR